MEENDQQDAFDIEEELNIEERGDETVDPVNELDDVNDRLDELQEEIEELNQRAETEQAELPSIFDPVFPARLSAYSSGVGGSYVELYTSGHAFADFASGRGTTLTSGNNSLFGLPETGFLCVEKLDDGTPRTFALHGGIVDVYLTSLGGGSYDGYLDSGKTKKVFSNQTGTPATAGATRGLARLVDKAYRFIGPLLTSSSAVVMNVIDWRTDGSTGTVTSQAQTVLAAGSTATSTFTISGGTGGGGNVHVLISTATGSGNGTFTLVPAPNPSANGGIYETVICGHIIGDEGGATDPYTGGPCRTLFNLVSYGGSLTLGMQINWGESSFVLRIQTVTGTANDATTSAHITAGGNNLGIMDAQIPFNRWDVQNYLFTLTGGTIETGGGPVTVPSPNFQNNKAYGAPADATADRVAGHTLHTDSGVSLLITAFGIGSTVTASIDSVTSVLITP